MDCPVCKNAMITMELEEVEIDYCTGCNGIWLDKGEMEMLLGDGGKSKELIGSFQKSPPTGEVQRQCPICDKKMEKIIVGDDRQALLLDRCGRGDGLWFDKGELSNIIDRAKLDEGDKIKRLLGEMFGRKTEDR